MDAVLQALVMGIVQGLTEFLPVSSSGHLIIVPALAGWHDPFITSLAFSVMLHIGTLVAPAARDGSHVPQGTGHRVRPGPCPHSRDQPFGDLDLGGIVRRPRPRI